MKRILTLLTVCLMASMAMAQNAGIMVSVNKGQGGLKFFRSNQLMEAIEAAEINDTLYFTAGSFDFYQLPTINDDYYKREWSKPLVVIGAGAQNDNGTSVSMPGTLFLKFDESIPLVKRNMSFEGINIPNWVSPGSEVNALNFKNFRGDFYDRNELVQNESDAEDWVKPHTYVHNVKFDECQMDNINLEEGNVKKIEVVNTKARTVRGYCSDLVFTLNHCDIDVLGNSSDPMNGFIGLVKNSAINWDYSGANAQLTTSGVYNSNNSDNKNNCIYINSYPWPDKENLSASGEGSVILADGSVMGTYPSFSLYPSYPTLDPASSEIDYYQGSVTITVNLLGSNKEANE